MWDLIYALREEIGNPDLFVGSHEELARLLEWADEARRADVKDDDVFVGQALPASSSRRDIFFAGSAGFHDRPSRDRQRPPHRMSGRAREPSPGPAVPWQRVLGGDSAGHRRQTFHNVSEKLGVSGRRQVVARATELGLLDVG